MKTIFSVMLASFLLAALPGMDAMAQEVPGWENATPTLEPVLINPEAPPPGWGVRGRSRRRGRCFVQRGGHHHNGNQRIGGKPWQ